MKRIKKQTISLVTATTILLSSTNLNAWNPKDDFLSNTTGVGSYSDDYTKAKYMYGGSIVYKFKNQSRSTGPLFSFQAPKIKAGCNGISITGGFLQVLGLDGLADQLRDSSTAIVYGIIIGLIYSTPAINQTLDQVRKIANWLQKFNQDACNIGRTIGANLAKNEKYQGTMQAGADVFNGLIESGDDKATEWLGDIGKALPEEITSTVSDLLKSDNEGTKPSKAKTASTEFDNYFRKIGLAGIVLNEELLNPSSSANIELEEIVITGSTDTERFYLVLNMLFGDSGFDAKTTQWITESDRAKYITESITLGKITTETAATKKAKEIAATLKEPAQALPKPSYKYSTTKSEYTTEQKVNILLFGSETEASTTATPFQLKQAKVLVAKLKLYGQNVTKELISFSGTKDTTINSNWDGLYNLSKKNVDCSLGYLKGEQSSCESFPILFGKYIEYINTIKDLEVKLSKSHGQAYASGVSEPYREALAKFNAYKVSELMVGAIIEETLAYKRNSNFPDDESVAKRIDELQEVKKQISTIIQNDIFFQNDVTETIDTLFKKVKQELIMDKLQ